MTEAVINGLVGYLRRKNYTEATVSAYSALAERLDLDPATCTAADLEAVVHTHGLTPASRNAYTFALRRLFDYCQLAGLREDNPAKALTLAKMPPLNPPDVMSPEQWKSLVKAEASLKYRALFYVLAGAGLRISEALGLRLKDYADGTVTVHNGKGRKDRRVTLPDRARVALNGYINSDFAGNEGNPALFAVTRENVSRRLKVAAKKAGIENVAIHPHALRHMFATRCVGKEVDLITLAQLMGHSDLETTKRYVAATQERRSAVAAKLKGVI